MSDQLLSRDWLLVSEQFLSHQGEGPSSGELAAFLRLGACNLHCWWCDTPYTWAFDKRHAEQHFSKIQYDPRAELSRQSITEVSRWLQQQPGRLIVITGGEPLLQAGQLAKLISEVNEEKTVRFEIETAGTIAPLELDCFENVNYNVSLKLGNSGNTLEERLVEKSVLYFAIETDCVFKFVVDGPGPTVDIDEIERIVGRYQIAPERIWLMPIGTTAETLTKGLETLAPIALDHGWNITSRMHIYAYGDKKGT